VATRGYELPWMMVVKKVMMVRMLSWCFFGFEKRGKFQSFLSHWIYLSFFFCLGEEGVKAKDVMVFEFLWDLGSVLFWLVPAINLIRVEYLKQEALRGGKRI